MQTDNIHLVGTEKIVVTENGIKVGVAHPTMESAQAKAQERKKLAESGSNPAPTVAVKQQLFG